MRLGDYDALNARIDKCVGIDGLGLEPLMAIRDIKALISVMPAIDAIPVEWIISWSNKRYRETQKDVSIVDVLAAWKQEQEVQDG